MREVPLHRVTSLKKNAPPLGPPVPTVPLPHEKSSPPPRTIGIAKLSVLRGGSVLSRYPCRVLYS